MEKSILGLLSIILFSNIVYANDVPADLLSNIETHGVKHLRLMKIPDDKDANEKVEKNYMYCFEHHCLIRLSKNKEKCGIWHHPNLEPTEIPCIEWVKEYDNLGKLKRYQSYTIGQRSDIIKEEQLVDWHENGLAKRICYYGYSVCHYFNETGELIKKCHETPGYSNCSEYDLQKNEWTKYKIYWMS